MLKKYLLFSLTLILFSCGETIKKQEFKSPEEIYGELFEQVQSKAIFSDSKTFIDCIPKGESEAILEKYTAEKTKPNFDLKKFVLENFSMPKSYPNNFVSNQNFSVEQHINSLWSVLIRQPENDGGSLIPLRKSYAVLSGNASEVYYQDSYFMMLGLQTAKKDSIISNMVLNYAQFIQDFGYIPTANRSYYLGRSEAPFFSLMVKLLAETQNDKQILVRYLPQMQREYQYWLTAEGPEEVEKQAEALKKGLKAYRKAVFVEKDNVLSRYYDEKETPRPEAYKEDVAIAKKTNRKPNEIYQDLRSATESSFGLSSRWLKDGKNLQTIHTTAILPVDLNALLYHLELTIAEAYEIKGEKHYAESMKKLAEKRKKIFDKYFWNETTGFYFDYDFVAQKQKETYSLAGVYPLVFNLASPQQAEKVAENLKNKFLQVGGLGTTLDSNEGLASLQWMAIVGLRNYEKNELANQIKQNWIENCTKTYKNTGKMLEKYDVTMQTMREESKIVNGFGSTNGVLLKLLSEK